MNGSNRKKICRAILKALEVWQSAADLEFYEMPFDKYRGLGTCSELIGSGCKNRYVNDYISNKIGDTAQIRIGFANKDHWVGNTHCPLPLYGSTLAHAYFPSAGDISGDAHFSWTKKWSYRKSTDRYEDTDLFLVAVHEFGHSLGLEHSPDRRDIMYPSYQYKDWSKLRGDTKDWYYKILSDYDITRIQYKYGRQSDQNRKSCFLGATRRYKFKKGR